MASIFQSSDDLLTAFRKLPRIERSILQLLSIFMEHVNRTSLAQYLYESGIRDNNGKSISVVTLSVKVSNLSDQGFLTYDNFLSHHFYCHASVVDVATQSAVDEGCFLGMANAARKFLPAITSYGAASFRGNSILSFVRCLREIRNALFGQDQELLIKYMQLGREQFPDQLALNPPLVRLCATPFDRLWFRALPLSIQRLALEEIVPAYLENLQEVTEILLLLQEYRHFSSEKYGPNFRALLVTIFLIQGKLTQAQEILVAEEPVDDVIALKGWLSFMQGKNELSIQCYEAALLALQRESRSKNIFFTGLAGIFFILALLKSKEPAHYNRIDVFLACVRKQKIGVAMPTYPCFESLLLAQRNEMDQGLIHLEAIQQRTTKHKTTQIGFILESVVRYWIDVRHTEKYCLDLKKLCCHAQQMGYQWPALECATLLQHWEEDVESHKAYISQVEQQTGLQSILPVVIQEERWQRALKRLIQLTSDSELDKSKRSYKADCNRLIWLLWIENNAVLDIQAKEQSMTTSNRWSKGRSVRLKRMFEQSADLHFLTDHDRRIMRMISREKANFGGIPRYVFDYGRAILAMVGHPSVFWGESPTVNVEIVQVEPELLVEKIHGHVNLKFSTQLHQQGVIVSKESPTLCHVTEVTPTHKAIADVLGESGLRIPEKGKKKVLEVMHALSSLVTIQSSIGGGQETVESVVADATPHIQLLPFGDGLKTKIFVRPFGRGGPYFIPGKGGKTIIAEVGGKRVQTHRNLLVERRLAQDVMSLCPGLADADDLQEAWIFEEPEACLELLLALQQCDNVAIEWPEGEKLRVSPPVSMNQLKVNIQRDNDWFALQGELVLDESVVFEMDRLLALVHQSTGRFIPLGDGQFMALTETFRKQLLEIAAFSEKSAQGQRFHPLAAPLVQEIAEQAGALAVDKYWKRHLHHIQKTQNLHVPLPSTLQAEMREYQLTGFYWLSRLAAWGVGACLADDMGLGKTVQALALILSRATEGPVLVVAPTSVCFNWLKEMERFAPTLNGLFFSGVRRQQMLDELKPFDVLVCSYGLLQQEGSMLADVPWNVVVLDEAQSIKNRGTKRSKSAMALKAGFKMILTGTPIENHLGELWNLFHFINPGLLGSVELFNERFAIPIERHRNKDARGQLKKLIQPFLLRRAKSQVLEELPPRTEITLQVEMSAEETAFYEALRRRALEQINNLQGPLQQNQLQILAEIMRLRRACCNSRLIVADSPIVSTKLELFWTVVEELLENRHKVLVFSQFVDHLAIIRERLDSKKVRYQYLDGSTPSKERQRRVEAFQSGEGDLFLISLRAGGMGINLTAADYVIHMDPWWNPAVEDQASDRAHRIGQKRPVTIYRLVTKGTIEEMIVALHHHKRNLADGLLDGSDISGRLNAEELLHIIRGQG